jgi:hypothetical protein
MRVPPVPAEHDQVAALAALAPAALASEPLSPPLAPRSGAPPPRAAPAAADAPRLSAPLQRAPPLTDPAAAPFRLPPELALTADDDTAGPDRHWIIKVLEIGGLNILGVWLVQQALRAIMDTSAPVTLVKVSPGAAAARQGVGAWDAVSRGGLCALRLPCLSPHP